MKSLIQVSMTLLVMYQLYSFLKNIVKYGVRVTMAQSNIYIYKGNYNKLLQLAAVISVGAVTIIYNIKIVRIYFKHLFQSNINKLIEYEINGIILIISTMFILILISNILLKEILDIKLYERGILYSDGSFIKWSDIKNIEYKRAYIGNEKKMIITLKNNRKISLKNRDKNNFEELKILIFEKGGMIVKEITIA